MFTQFAVLAILFADTDLDQVSIGIASRQTSDLGAETKKKLGMPKRDGLIAVGVFPYSPAATSKLHPFDIIIAVNNVPVSTNAQLIDSLADFKSGDSVKVDVYSAKPGKNKIIWGASSTKLTVKLKTQREIAMSNVKEERDKVTGLATITHKDSPDTVRSNDISFYFTVDKGKVSPLRMMVTYFDDDWIFAESITISDGSSPLKIDMKNQWSHDNSGGRVWEWAAIDVREKFLNELNELLYRTDVTIRYEGNQKFHDRSFTAEERSRMMIMLTAYEAYGGKLLE